LRGNHQERFSYQTPGAGKVTVILFLARGGWSFRSVAATKAARFQKSNIWLINIPEIK
jgi:hypothetical protein